MRDSFRQAYPTTMTAEEFVNKLFDAAELTPFEAERKPQINSMRKRYEEPGSCAAGGNRGASYRSSLMRMRNVVYESANYNPQAIQMT